MFIMDHLESSRRDDIMWIPPQQLRGTRHSGMIIATLDELGLTEAVIGVVGLGPHMPWHPEGIVPHGLWNNVLTRFPEAGADPAGDRNCRFLIGAVHVGPPARAAPTSPSPSPPRSN